MDGVPSGEFAIPSAKLCNLLLFLNRHEESQGHENNESKNMLLTPSGLISVLSPMYAAVRIVAAPDVSPG